MEFRAAIEKDADDLRTLADRAAAVSGRDDFLPCQIASGNDWLTQERQLDAAAMTLRRNWLGVAHRPGDATLKSPSAGHVAHVACGSDVSFGYERDIDVSLLEQRRSYLRAPAGWGTDLILFRSGQAALACLVHFAAAQWGKSHPLTVAHVGAYFETASLLASWPQRMIRQVDDAAAADIVIAEPVWCDGQFGCGKRLPMARHALLLDITMSGPTYDLAPHLDDCPLVIAYSSGLKLDQAGLELANAGIVRVLTRDGTMEVGTALRHLRGLTGSGLTLDELSALSAPWFMDRAYAEHYTAAIFDNNRALAEAVGSRSPLRPVLPSLSRKSRDRGTVLCIDPQRAIARALPRARNEDRRRMRAPGTSRHQGRFVRLSRPPVRTHRARGRPDFPARGDGLARRLEPAGPVRAVRRTRSLSTFPPPSS